jgi:hypothetical protein
VRPRASSSQCGGAGATEVESTSAGRRRSLDAVLVEEEVLTRWWQWSAGVANTVAFGAGKAFASNTSSAGHRPRAAKRPATDWDTIAAKQARLLATYLAPDPTVGAALSLLVVEALATLSSSYVAVRTGSRWGS